VDLVLDGGARFRFSEVVRTYSLTLAGGSAVVGTAGPLLDDRACHLRSHWTASDRRPYSEHRNPLRKLNFTGIELIEPSGRSINPIMPHKFRC